MGVQCEADLGLGRDGLSIIILGVQSMYRESEVDADPCKFGMWYPRLKFPSDLLCDLEDEEAWRPVSFTQTCVPSQFFHRSCSPSS